MAAAVRGILVLDISSTVDDLGFIGGRAACALVPTAVPTGATVWLDIGAGRAVLGGIGALIANLRPAGTVAVIGTDPAGISFVHCRLTSAFTTQETAA